MGFYYKPETGWAADFIPFWWDGAFQLFYLHDYRDVERCGEGTPWFRISTKDFVHFQEHGEMLPRGGMEEQDLYVFTGSVIRAQGRFHIFYTGHNPHLRAQGLPEQAVMHAVSDDLDHWIKIPEDTFFSPAELGYEPHDWRDPFVFFDDADGLYHMLLAARRTDGPATRRGCTAHCTSPDLKSWTVAEPLWAPDSYFTHECPDLFRMGDWYYLIYSEFSDIKRTRYVMSRSLYGPWVAPEDDVFDTGLYYAAKSFADESGRYLFGWHATKSGDCDAGAIQWGGNLVVHQLGQRADGTLYTREPGALRAYWGDGQLLQKEVLLDRADGMELRTLCALPECCRLTCEARFADKTRLFGLRVHGDAQSDTGYGLFFYPAARSLSIDVLPNQQWGQYYARSLTRILPMQPDHPLRLTLTLDGSMLTLYADDQVAFSARMYDLKGAELALFVQHGAARFENLRLYLPRG